MKNEYEKLQKKETYFPGIFYSNLHYVNLIKNWFILTMGENKNTKS